MLKQREKEGLGFELRCNDEGVATHIFVQLDDAMKDWANDTSNVLLFDPTWGTHRAGMKLCCFTSVSPHGQSVVLSFALLVDETTDSILWSFRAFSKHFKKPPTVVFTDDATSISIAFTSMHDAGISTNPVRSKSEAVFLMLKRERVFFRHGNEANRRHAHVT